jgi:hypothetical protein
VWSLENPRAVADGVVLDAAASAVEGSLSWADLAAGGKVEVVVDKVFEETGVYREWVSRYVIFPLTRIGVLVLQIESMQKQ